MKDTESIGDRVRGYFEERYHGLACGRAASFGEFCLGAGMEAEEREYNHELRRAKELGLCYRDYEFSLDFTRMFVEYDRAWVKLKERHRVVFELTPATVSAMKGLIHTLTLRKTGSRWYITSHRYRNEMKEGPGNRWPAMGLMPDWCNPAPHKSRLPVPRISGYNRNAAVEYAHRWALGRNPKYYDFENLGGDCTNFCSQVLHAGGCPMNNTKGTGWYYYSLNNRSPSWTGVEFFYRFITGNKNTGPRGQEVSPSGIDLGDVIQLDFSHDDVFNHCLIVVANPEPGNINRILISCHTVDRDNYPLVYYNWRSVRYIHVTGCGR